MQPLAPPKPQEPQITDFTYFLLNKELLLSILTKFTDRPENYRVWKESFKSIVSKLKVNPFEELDLLAKWLDVESARQAINIRASNMNHPELCLIRVWERLDEKYGAAEMVDCLFEIRKIAVCFLWLSLPGDYRVTGEALLAETT